MRPSLELLLARDVVDHVLSDLWSHDSNRSAIRWMHEAVLEEALDGVVHVDVPALHDVSHLGIGPLSGAKVGHAPKPERHHLPLLGEREVSVELVRVPAWLLGTRVLELIPTG